MLSANMLDLLVTVQLQMLTEEDKKVRSDLFSFL